VALASGTFVILVVLRTVRLLRGQELVNRRFESLVRNASDLVTLIDAETKILFVSPSAERLLGHTPETLEGTSFVEMINPDQAGRALEFILGESADDCPIEISLRCADGTWLETETLRTNLLHEPSVQGIVLNTRDITERKAFLNQLEHHAFYDSLTGLANRALFRDRVKHALSQARRASNSVATLFMDVDDFKVVNDTHGHAVGDALLTAIGGRIRSCLRGGDTVSRLGGGR
jgi:PAS domain S-box-containing protein